MRQSLQGAQGPSNVDPIPTNTRVRTVGWHVGWALRVLIGIHNREIPQSRSKYDWSGLPRRGITAYLQRGQPCARGADGASCPSATSWAYRKDVPVTYLEKYQPVFVRDLFVLVALILIEEAYVDA